MELPVLFAIDDEAPVLNAVERDLRRRFDREYRVMKAGSGLEALEAVRRLRERGVGVALFLVDQRMPGMSGTDFLAEARTHYPEGRRVLLTAYADTDAAIAAINLVQLHHYLLKPWDPPEQQLYPVLEDLLADWRASYEPRFEGITLVGMRWSRDTHRIKDFLARNLVPFRWMDAAADAAAAALIERAVGDQVRLPLVIFPDGSHLVTPSNPELADRIGLRTRAALDSYDLVIVGGGPAGLAAAVYGASEGLQTALIERQAPGGQAGTSSRIENYLGFPSGLSGADLAHRAVAQARRFGAELLSAEVDSVRSEGPYRIVRLGNGSDIAARALVIASGVSYRQLDVPGIDRLTGAGVYYGASLSEALAVRGEDVFLVGGGNSAGQAAVHFAHYCSTVTLLVRAPDVERSMSRYLIDQIAEIPNIRVRTLTCVTEVHGDSRLEAITIEAPGDLRQREVLPTSAQFIFIGATPHTEWLGRYVLRDAAGFILAGPDLLRDDVPAGTWRLKRPPFLLETNVPGVFVAGDVRCRSIKRVASATGEGAMCVHFVHQYLGGS